MVNLKERSPQTKNMNKIKALVVVVIALVTFSNVNAQEVYNEGNLSEAELASSNIYWAKGYVVDSKKGNLEGKIQFLIEDVKLRNPNSGMVDLDLADLGKKVTLAYENKRGKTKYSDYGSKKGLKFCVFLNDEETCFRGLKVKGKGLELAAGALSSLNFDTSRYYQIVSESDEVSLYKEYASESNQFIIKISSDKKGYMFDTNDKQKNIEKLVDYLDGKVASSDLEDLDFTSLEDVQKLIELYKKQ